MDSHSKFAPYVHHIFVSFSNTLIYTHRLGEILFLHDWLESWDEFEKINPRFCDLWKHTPFADEVDHIPLFEPGKKKTVFDHTGVF